MQVEAVNALVKKKVPRLYLLYMYCLSHSLLLVLTDSQERGRVQPLEVLPPPPAPEQTIIIQQAPNAPVAEAPPTPEPVAVIRTFNLLISGDAIGMPQLLKISTESVEVIETPAPPNRTLLPSLHSGRMSCVVLGLPLVGEVLIQVSTTTGNLPAHPVRLRGRQEPRVFHILRA
jgi:hypothetical protein